MKRSAILLTVFAVSLVLDVYSPVHGHDAITTTITWNREVSRIFTDRCVSCHRENGAAFSLGTYEDARPWAVAIKEEVLAKRMPPWGAVKGFREFRNDQALTAEQVEMITAWVEGGVPEGDARDLPVQPLTPGVWPADAGNPAGALAISGDFMLAHEFVLDGLAPRKIPEGSSPQIVADIPGVGIEPLLWLYQYQPEFAHPFLFQTPLSLPARTTILGVPAGSTILLLPATAATPIPGPPPEPLPEPLPEPGK